MDTASLMWDETGRDYDHERAELARTAALNDAEQMVGPLVFQAGNDIDLIHRLALVEPHLQAISSLRGYPVKELTGDLTRRWRLLAQARTAAAHKTAARQVTAAKERVMDTVAARLAAVAARENPDVPMQECLKLAAEAVRKHADAHPLAYDSWADVADGPFTDRAKKWRPPGMGDGKKGPTDPGPDGGMSTYDEAHSRLDDLEKKLDGMSGPPGPASPAGPRTAALEPTVAAFYQRLTDWWKGPGETSASPSKPSSTPAPFTGTPPRFMGFPAPSTRPTLPDLLDHEERALEERRQRIKPQAPSHSQKPNPEDPRASYLPRGFTEHPRQDAAPAATPAPDPTGWRSEAPVRHAEDHADRAEHDAHDDAHRAEFGTLFNQFDQARAEMAGKWDRNLAGPGASPEYTKQHDPLRGFDQARSEMADKWDANLAGPGASENYRPPVPGGFSHADTGHDGGQQMLPTDPADHAFSHAEQGQTPRKRQDWNIPTHFQHGASLFD